MQRPFVSLLLLLLALLLAHCAGQISPSGGPPDQEPPTVIHTRPDSNATRVTTQSIQLEFSEYVDRRSVEESIFISPYVGAPEFDWSGTSVTISYPESLRHNTTYVVNVGTDVRDVRAQNNMSSGFTLAFSTGDSIDQGSISGRVFDEKPSGIMIFAYALTTSRVDSLDPSIVKPDYIMQTGTSGTFTLSNIALGVYRLFAVRDEYRNLLYDKETDQFGTLPGDITLDARQKRVTNVWFLLSREDTTRPFITNVDATNRYDVVARFSEALDTLSFDRATFSITDTLSGDRVPIRVSYLSRVVPSIATFVMQNPLDSGATYRLRVGGIFDRAGNPVDSAHATATFLGKNTPDTLKPTIAVHGLPDSTRGVAADQVFEVRFSKAVVQPAVEHAITLEDSSRSPVSFRLTWLGATDVGMRPLKPLQGDEWYRIRVMMDSVRDFQGNGYKDSTFVLRFQTLDPKTTGTLQGKVIDRLEQSAVGDIYVTAQGLDANPQTQRTVRLSVPGPFTFAQLPEGRYSFHAFRDADGSGAYSFGRPFPFIQSERFVTFPDTIRVRPRWTFEGVTLTFP